MLDQGDIVITVGNGWIILVVDGGAIHGHVFTRASTAAGAFLAQGDRGVGSADRGEIWGPSANPTLLAKSGSACKPDELAEVRPPGWRDRDAGQPVADPD